MMRIRFWNHQKATKQEAKRFSYNLDTSNNIVELDLEYISLYL